MTEITPELKALADAERELVEAAVEMDINNASMKSIRKVGEKAQAVRNLRAAQAKECRPPADAKDGSLWWLTLGDESACLKWHLEMWWDFGVNEPSRDQMLGWTVHSECRFGETGVEATDNRVHEFIREFRKTHRFANEWDAEHQMIKDAIAHFRAPKLEISDEELAEIGRKFKVSGGLRFSDFDERLKQAARAVIAKVGGEK